MERHGLQLRFAALPGKREELVDQLIEAAATLAEVAECESFVVGTTLDDPRGVAISEVWRSRADFERVGETEPFNSIAQSALALIDGQPSVAAFVALGGKGLSGSGRQGDPDFASIDALAARFFDAIEAGDFATLENIYAPDATVWNNTRPEETAHENMNRLRGNLSAVDSLTYEDVRRNCFPGGFVQQHVVRLRGSDGSDHTFPVCVVVAVDEGRITQIREYWDSASR